MNSTPRMGQDSVQNSNQKSVTTTTSKPNVNVYFTKRIDEKGKFYYIHNDETSTGQITYDIPPHGADIPLHYPPLELTLTKQEQMEQKAQWDKWNTTKLQKKMIRSQVIQDIRLRHKTEERRRLQYNQEMISNQRDDLWRKACDRGQMNGIVSLNDYQLGYISDRIYTFQNDYNVPLRSLTLHANELTWSAIEALFTSSDSDNNDCTRTLSSTTTITTTLYKLSLASNRIESLGSQIANMKQLTHLNLVRNGLTSLPYAIGQLIHLQELDLSNNTLQHLPPSIGMLINIKVLRLECNQLIQLPNDIGKLHTCEEINVNSNHLSTLPGSIGSMKGLRTLLANDNELRFLPVEVSNCITLQILHLSRNNIRELPQSIEKMIHLTSIWLDYNLISTLPHGFHHLIHLNDLKLEGNKDLIYPTMDVVVKGAREVIKWCKLKLAYKERSREKNIVLDTLSLLEQIELHRVSGDYGITSKRTRTGASVGTATTTTTTTRNARTYASEKNSGHFHQHHEAVFESNVLYKGGKVFI